MSYRRMALEIEPAVCRVLVDTVEETLAEPPSQRPPLSPNGECYRLSGDNQVRPIIEPVLEATFPGAWLYVDLLTLYPDGVIHRHTDGHKGWVRTHVALQTNDECWSYAGGIWSQLPLGGVWELDTREPHGSVNWGRTPRIHVIFDVARS